MLHQKSSLFVLQSCGPRTRSIMVLQIVAFWQDDEHMTAGRKYSLSRSVSGVVLTTHALTYRLVLSRHIMSRLKLWQLEVLCILPACQRHVHVQELHNLTIGGDLKRLSARRSSSRVSTGPLRADWCATNYVVREVSQNNHQYGVVAQSCPLGAAV